MQSLLKQNLRLDGRSFLELREIKIKKVSLNSVMVEVCGTILSVKIQGPFDKPRSRIKLNIQLEGTQKNDEFAKALTNIFEKFIILPENSSLDIFISIKQEDGSLFVTMINSLSIALCCSGINMRELVFGITVGLYGNNFIIDVLGSEERAGYINYIFAEEKCIYLKSQNKITEISLIKMIDLAEEHKKSVYENYANFLRNLN